jgi:glycosyltransferase involved in cell wall biosynthesis
MRILAIVHGYPKIHNAGAEWMLHSMLKHAVDNGHDCEVLLPISDLVPYTFEGVKVNRDTFSETRPKLQEADIVLTHLDRYGKVNNMCEFYRKPMVLIVHNSHKYPGMNGRWDFKKYAIYNSRFTAAAVKYDRPSIIVHPPINTEDYKTKPGKLVTLVNLFEPKGGLVLQEIAREMPDVKFMGVRGGYGKQEVDNSIRNITYVDNTPDMKKIYGKSKIVLMPSSYESYGRVAIEALCSGIPVIAHPTPGLRESLDFAGIFADRKNISEWVAAIRKLEDPAEYKAASEKALERVKDIEKTKKIELREMLKFFEAIKNGKA